MFHVGQFTSMKEVERREMLLYLMNTMKRLNVDNLTFFRMAHIWSFGTDPVLSDDVAQFMLHGIIPKYVQSYLRHLQGD